MLKRVIRFLRRFGPLNRRRYPRLEPRQVIKCVCAYMDRGLPVECPAEIIDVSRGGLLLMTNENKIYPHTELKIKFRLPIYLEELSISGVVVRTFRRHLQSWYHSGIKVKKSDPGIKLLVDFASGKKTLP
ncbi:MAG: PilZ domain-containing protein [Candidatus Omnitrophica bacterium]|nr:PilZ domain-containing protein [Candidatus Omnitrophota bacterium]MDD5238084.1 PilZ domain-containing protein [Candidatus Omnitrophota bacterium]